MYMTIKQVASETRIPFHTIHKWCVHKRVTFIAAGTSGNSSATGKDGRVIYHNVIKIDRAYHKCVSLYKSRFGHRKHKRVTAASLLKFSPKGRKTTGWR